MRTKLFCTAAVTLLAALLTGCSSAHEKSHATAEKTETHQEEHATGEHDHDQKHDHEHEEEDHQHGTEGEAHAGEAAHSPEEIIFTPTQAQAAGVEIETVQPADFSEVIAVTGDVLPAQGAQATVTATMNGIIQLANNSLTEGSKVGKNQTLFHISTQELGDGNPVAAAKAELEAAEKEWERAQQLIADKVISQREYEAARLRYETAKSTSKSLGNGKARRAVQSPLAGYIQTLQVKNGDFVTAGQAIATVSQNQHLQLRAEVPERYYYALNNIASANFRLTYAPDTTFELSRMNGRLLSSGRTTEKGNGFLPVIFEFNNVGNIVPGSLAEIYLLGKTQPNTLSLPVTALTEELGLYYVYIQTSDHGYRKQKVETGATDGKRIVITTGIHAGDKVVSKGAVAIKLAANSGVIPESCAGHNH